jgi:hypothetical protein
MSARTDAPYLAGLFDGEGFISLARNGRGLTLFMGVEMTDREGVAAFARFFDGKVTTLTRRTDTSKRRVYRWVVTGQNVAGPLRRLLPHLRVKQDQARVALAYLKWRGAGHRGVKATAEQLVVEEKYRRELARLKVPGEYLATGDDNAKQEKAATDTGECVKEGSPKREKEAGAEG